jgi:hypothetical protein
MWNIAMSTGEISVDDCPFEVLSTKGKTIPLQTVTGPEGSRRLRLPDFKTIGT